ncbi:MAG: hypothetical protein HYW48_01740 [Deltaproteobacteria bacterium]|nr:hypothetical protein [Deltaproteobacteria bacterium]
MPKLQVTGLSFFFLLSLVVSCGDSGGKHGGSKGPESPVEQAFLESAAKYGLPPRLLMAVAYLESRMNPRKAFTLYGAEEKGPVIGQTAFGISRQDLRVAEGADGDSFKIQIAAYGQWLSEKLKGLKLPKDPASSEEKFSWIWQVAQAHRQGSLAERDLRVLFAKELMEILNSGFTWQDAESKTVIQLPKESPVLQSKNFRDVPEDLLRLRTSPAQVFSARYFPLVQHSSGEEKIVPKGLEIIHCPFALSACLEAQGADSGELIEAHYVLPQDNTFFETPLQLTPHEIPLRRLRTDGVITKNDKVVIMLSGASGKMVGGSRLDANPLWLTKWQLHRLGELVVDVCAQLAYDHRESLLLSKEECVQVGKGVSFRTQGENDPYEWGDIDDYDHKIFTSYLSSPGGLSGETEFVFKTEQKIFEQGAPVPFHLAFQLDVRTLELEKLVRCSHGRTVWSVIERIGVRSETKKEFERTFWDGGPNKNGEQFLRAKVRGKKGELKGWAMTTLMIKNFETEEDVESLDPPECVGY